MSIEKSAGAIIYRKQGEEIFYLLIRYGAGHWDFPRGLIEKGEKLEETAKREIQEETGLENLKFASGFKETIKYFFKWEGKNSSKALKKPTGFHGIFMASCELFYFLRNFFLFFFLLSFVLFPFLLDKEHNNRKYYH